MSRLHYAVALPIILAGIVVATGAQAASLRVGDAVQIVREVSGRQSNDQSWGSKAEGDDVYENEYIRTAVESQARFLLVDRTALAVGPITTIRIDRVVYNPDQSIKGVVVSAGQGTVRWTSGDSSAYLIRTPTASVTPMGTVFDLFVDSQRTFVILRQGRVKVCTISLQQTCKTLTDPGEMMLATADELQGPGGGGPSSADFANRCLSATGQDCVMNLTYSPPTAPQRDQAPQRDPPAPKKSKRADVQPSRPTVIKEPQPGRPRVVERQPSPPEVDVGGAVLNAFGLALGSSFMPHRSSPTGVGPYPPTRTNPPPRGGTNPNGQIVHSGPSVPLGPSVNPGPSVNVGPGPSNIMNRGKTSSTILNRAFPSRGANVN
jgi:FecR protein